MSVPADLSGPDPICNAMELLQLLWMRKWIVAVCVATSLLAGTTYYLLLPKRYQVQASLLVQPMSSSTPSLAPRLSTNTCRNILLSTTVLQDAIERLGSESRIDDLGSSLEGRVTALRKNLTVKVIRRSNTLNIVYQAKDPQAGKATVESILIVYQEFLDKFCKNTTQRVLDLLETDPLDPQIQLLAETKDPKTQALLAAVKAAIRDEKNNQSILSLIEGIDPGRDNGGMRTAVLSPPSVSPRATRDQLGVVLFVCLSLGFGGGAGIAYSCNALDDRFRSAEQIQTSTELPVLAEIGQLASFDGQPFHQTHVLVHPNDEETDALRTLRGALACVAIDARCLVVSSVDPGDGKTAIAANLAVSLARAGRRTLLIDANMRYPGFSTNFDVHGLDVHGQRRGLSVLLREDHPIGKSAEAHLACVPDVEGLNVLSAGPCPSNPIELLEGDRMAELLRWADAHYDRILIDGPIARLGDMATLGRLADGILFVIQPEKNKCCNVLWTLERFATFGIRVLGLVVSQPVTKNSIYRRWPRLSQPIPAAEPDDRDYPIKPHVFPADDTASKAA